jgi:cell division ATPase FtsA
MLPRRVRQVTEEVISKTFHPDRLSCHSFTAAIQRAFTKQFSHPKTFLVVNVDEEMTQLLIVNSGVLMGSVSYPVGSHFLIRQLAKELDVPAGDAKSRLYQHQNKEAESRTAQDIERILTQTQERWQDLLVDSLGEFSADVSIPEYAFVLANHDVRGTFREFTQGVTVGQHLLRTDGFRVHEVSDDLLQIHVQSQQDHTDHYLSIAGLIHEHTK